MAGTVSWNGLRELASFRAEKGCAISCYLGLDPSDAPTAGGVQTRVKSLLDEAAKSGGSDPSNLTHDQREALKEDFERIRRYFEDEFVRDGAHGAVVFCAGLDNFWGPIALSEAVPNGVKVGREFYLAPLVPLLGRGEGALVAAVSRERGEVYGLRGGRLVEVADRSDEQPGNDQKGRSDARFQRHVEHLVQDHLKDVAGEVERQVKRLGSPAVVVVCVEEMRSDIGDLLGPETQKVLAGWTQAEAHASPAELLEAVKPVLEQSREEQEREAIERWREETGRSGRASSGWGATLEAASDGRVEALLFQEGADRPAFRCPGCGRVSAASGSCPLDGMKMEEAEAGIDLAVHQTLQHGGALWALRHHQDLEPVEGIGALLRY